MKIFEMLLNKKKEIETLRETLDDLENSIKKVLLSKEDTLNEIESLEKELDALTLKTKEKNTLCIIKLIAFFISLLIGYTLISMIRYNIFNLHDLIGILGASFTTFIIEEILTKKVKKNAEDKRTKNNALIESISEKLELTRERERDISNEEIRLLNARNKTCFEIRDKTKDYTAIEDIAIKHLAPYLDELITQDLEKGNIDLELDLKRVKQKIDANSHN